MVQASRLGTRLPSSAISAAAPASTRRPPRGLLARGRIDDHAEPRDRDVCRERCEREQPHRRGASSPADGRAPCHARVAAEPARRGSSCGTPRRERGGFRQRPAAQLQPATVNAGSPASIGDGVTTYRTLPPNAGSERRDLPARAYPEDGGVARDRPMAERAATRLDHGQAGMRPRPARSAGSIRCGILSPGRISMQPAVGARCRHSDAAARTARSSASASSGFSASSTTTGDASAPPTSRRSTSSPLRARIGQWIRDAGLPWAVGAQPVHLGRQGALADAIAARRAGAHARARFGSVEPAGAMTDRLDPRQHEHALRLARPDLRSREPQRVPDVKCHGIDVVPASPQRPHTEHGPASTASGPPVPGLAANGCVTTPAGIGRAVRTRTSSGCSSPSITARRRRPLLDAGAASREPDPEPRRGVGDEQRDPGDVRGVVVEDHGREHDGHGEGERGACGGHGVRGPGLAPARRRRPRADRRWWRRGSGGGGAPARSERAPGRRREERDRVR